MNGTRCKHVPFDKPVLSQSKVSGRTVNVHEFMNHYPSLTSSKLCCRSSPPNVYL